MSHNIRIKRIDTSLPLPEYKTKGAVALDLSSRETTIIPPKEIRYLPLNVVIENPDNCFILIAPRSSLHKIGIMQANGIGIVDRDFCGEKDEYHFAAFNFTDKEVTIEKGTRIAQILALEFKPIEWEEVESMNKESRGGFGSTGRK
ncbi:MAG: dUTP diphosphatase [Nanoarchaeota archaeon]